MDDGRTPADRLAEEALSLMGSAMAKLEQDDAFALAAAHLQQAIDAMPYQSSAPPRD